MTPLSDFPLLKFVTEESHRSLEVCKGVGELFPSSFHASGNETFLSHDVHRKWILCFPTFLSLSKKLSSIQKSYLSCFTLDTCSAERKSEASVGPRKCNCDPRDFVADVCDKFFASQTLKCCGTCADLVPVKYLRQNVNERKVKMQTAEMSWHRRWNSSTLPHPSREELELSKFFPRTNLSRLHEPTEQFSSLSLSVFSFYFRKVRHGENQGCCKKV